MPAVLPENKRDSLENRLLRAEQRAREIRLKATERGEAVAQRMTPSRGLDEPAAGGPRPFVSIRRR